MPLALLSAQLQAISISLSLISMLLPQASQAAVYRVVPAEPPVQMPVPAPKPPLYGPFGDCRDEILSQAPRHGVGLDLAIFLSNIESNHKPDAKNPKSTATGCYQFLKGTWAELCKGDVLNARDNVACAMRLLSEGQLRHWTADPNTQRNLRAGGFIP